MPDNSAEVGAWSNEFSWPIIGIHAALTPDGKVLTFGTDQNGVQTGLHIYDVWDPVANTHVTLEHHTHSDIFCSAGLIVADTGEFLISGGDSRPLGVVNGGIPDVNVFDYRDESLTHSPTGPMEFSRWYGTAVTLGTGQIMMVGGRQNDDATYSPYPEIYTPGYGFRTLTGAYVDSFNNNALYPRVWLSSSGKVWTTAQGNQNIYAIDPAGSGAVDVVGSKPALITWQMPEVMFAPDKVLLVATDGSTWVMDISGAEAVFTQTDAIGTDRMWSNLTVLPDGRVMISGGSAVDNQLVGVEQTVEFWDPHTGHWSVEADAAVARLYHSTALLLPDGTVLNLGGGAPGPLTNTNGQIFHPDYLYDAGGTDAARPVISAAPAHLEVGDEFTIHVTGGGTIQTLALMPFGSVTHSINMNAQRIELSFHVLPNGDLQVDLPDNANLLTPGYWMLFAIDSHGTPSVAATIKIESELPDHQPQQLALDPGVAFATNGDAAYDGFDDSYALVPHATAAKHGSVMSNERLDLSHSFDLTFEINLGANDAGGDGITFVLHNDPAGNHALGGGGGALGAMGIGAGIAIEFDTYYSPDLADDIPNDHTTFMSTASGAAVAPVTDLGNIEDGAWHTVHLGWNGTTLAYTFDGIPMASLTADMVATYLGGSQLAYFGFTGGSGSASELAKVRIDKVDGTLEGGVPLHADRTDVARPPAFVVNGNATYNPALNKYVVTPDLPQQHGSVMTAERIDLAKSFVVAFDFKLGDGISADGDGIALVLHNDSLGSHAIGGTAGALGAVGIANGLALEFDTSQGAGSPSSTATGVGKFVDTDNGALGSPVTNLGHIDDGQWHHVKVVWNAAAETLSYSLDGTDVATLGQDIVATYLGGSHLGYLGITGATGGLSELEQVRILRLDATAADGKLLHLVGPNAGPTTVDDSYAVAANGSLTVSAGNGVLANDKDPDSDPLSICDDSHLLEHTALLAPANGTLTMNADGSFTYTPRAGFVGFDHFTYCAEDFSATCASGEVTIAVGNLEPLPNFVTNGNASAAGGANSYTLTPDVVQQRGSVISETRLDLTSTFALTFEINLGVKDDNGADGAAFVLHNDPAGSHALGGGGGTLGAMGIAAGVAIEFDTYDSADLADDIPNDHTNFMSTASGAAISAVTDLGNIEDGEWHNVVVTWDGSSLSYSFDGVAIAELDAGSVETLLGGADLAYFGFTAATGGLSNQMQVRVLSLVTSLTQQSVTVAGYLAAGTFPAAYAVTLADTSAHIGALTAAQFAGLAGNGVDIIDATDNVLALSVAAWRGLGSVALSQGDQVTLTDSGTNLAGLTAAEIGALAGSGVDRLDATTNPLSLSVAGWRALGSVALTPADVVALADTGANLATLTPAQIGTLAGSGVDRLDATDNALSLSVAAYRALGAVALTQADVVTLADTGANLATLTPAQIGALAGLGVDRLDATDNALSLSVAAYRARGAIALTQADIVTLADTGANLATLTQAQIGVLAGSGVDRLDATNNALSLTLAQYLALSAVTISSNDVLTITGTAANDTIQGRTNPDVINGSGGRDVLLGLGGSDRLSGGIGNDLINGGAGNDVLTGGGGNDTFFFNTALNASTNVDTITDFFVPGDTIQLENTGVFTKLAAGTLTAAAFYKGAAAHDASDRIIYNPTTGALLYDSNGSATGGAVKFAMLANSLALTHLDFFVV